MSLLLHSNKGSTRNDDDSLLLNSLRLLKVFNMSLFIVTVQQQQLGRRSWCRHQNNRLEWKERDVRACARSTRPQSK